MTMDVTPQSTEKTRKTEEILKKTLVIYVFLSLIPIYFSSQLPKTYFPHSRTFEKVSFQRR